MKDSIETYRVLVFVKGNPIHKQCLNDIRKRKLLMRSGMDLYESACCGYHPCCGFIKFNSLFYKLNLYISPFNQYTKLAPPFPNFCICHQYKTQL